MASASSDADQGGGSVTVLQALQQTCPAFDGTRVKKTDNTQSEPTVTISTWRIWKDFTFENIFAVFQEELQQEYMGTMQTLVLAKDTEICNEAALEASQRIYRMSIVNYALHSVDNGRDAPHYGVGTRIPDPRNVGKKGKQPDWSCVSDSHGMKNLVPGETKLSVKWDPDWEKLPGNNKDYGQWYTVLGQEASYMDIHKSRYGFIITDREVVALRMKKLIESDSDHSGSEYEEEPEDDHAMEYKTIKWSVEGEGKLTALLALWALAMLAKTGPRGIKTSYSGLDKKAATTKTGNSNRASASSSGSPDPEETQPTGRSSGSGASEPRGSQAAGKKAEAGASGSKERRPRKTPPATEPSDAPDDGEEEEAQPERAQAADKKEKKKKKVRVATTAPEDGEAEDEPSTGPKPLSSKPIPVRRKKQGNSEAPDDSQ